MVIIDFTNMAFVCLIHAVEYSAGSLLFLTFLWALAENVRFCFIKDVLAPLPCEVRMDILKLSLSRNFSNCAVDLVAVILAFERAKESDSAVLDCVN